MFTRAETEKSVTEFVEENKVKVEPVRSRDDIEVDAELAKIDKETDEMIAKKAKELSFEQKQESEREQYPEIDQLGAMLDNFVTQFRLNKKLGKQME